MQGVDILEQLFYSTDVYGLLGPFGLVLVGLFLINDRKYRPVAILWFVVECIVIAQYFDLLVTEPFYWWNIIIIIMGWVISVFQLVGKK